MLKREKKTRRVVIVDDEPDFLTLAKGWLEKSYDVVPLPDGQELLSQLERVDADALILDVRLPGPDGFKLCKGLRSRARFKDLPVLFLTASHSDADFFRNLEAGGTAYLTKPVSRKELLAKLEELLASR